MSTAFAPGAGLAGTRRPAALDQRIAGFLERHGDRLLDQVTRTESLFTRDDLLDVLRRTDWPALSPADPPMEPALAEALADAVLADPAHVAPVAQRDDRGQPLYAARDLLALEGDMLARADRMAGSGAGYLSPRQIDQVMTHFDRHFQAAGETVQPDYRQAFLDLQRPGELKLLEGPPGAHKSEMMKLLTKAFRASARGDRGVVVTALSDKITADGAHDAGADGVQFDAFIEQLEAGQAPLRPGGLVIVDEAGMLGSRQMARLLQATEAARLRVILIGDDRQIPPLTAGQPFRVMGERMPDAVATLVQTYRQKNPTDRQATLDLRAGHAEAAVEAYGARDLIAFQDGRKATLKAAARAFADWRAKDKNDGKTGIVLTNSARDAAYVNAQVRERLAADGALKGERRIRTVDGVTAFAEGDQVILRERLTGEDGHPVYAGATGRITAVDRRRLHMTVDGDTPRQLSIETDATPDLRHAYAMDLRTAQGIKVKRAFVAITQTMDNGEALVAFSRHQKKASFVVDQRIYPDLAAMARDFARPEVKLMSLEAATVTPDAPVAATAMGDGPGLAATAAAVRPADLSAEPLGVSSGAAPAPRRPAPRGASQGVP